ncbi:MAG: DinB family protein [Acidobacteria bacterium]|nr:DinB family protein [Acidobacteriota bacterium]
MFLDSITGLSEAQWNFKPGPEVWSVGEVAEHIALSEDMLFSRITAEILKSQPALENKAQAAGRDEAILKMIPDRSQKFKAPEPLVPKRRWASQRELVAHFDQSRARTARYLETTQEDLRSHFGQHPAGLLDAYQWFLLISAHTERHTAQIREVKAHAGFPAK